MIGPDRLRTVQDSERTELRGRGPEQAIAVAIVGVQALHDVLEVESLRVEVDVLERVGNAHRRGLHACQLCVGEERGLPLQHGGHALERHLADRLADQVTHQEAPLLSVHRERHRGFRVARGTFAVTFLCGGKHVDGKDPCRRAQGGEVGQPQREHREGIAELLCIGALRRSCIAAEEPRVRIARRQSQRESEDGLTHRLAHACNRGPLLAQPFACGWPLLLPRVRRGVRGHEAR